MMSSHTTTTPLYSNLRHKGPRVTMDGRELLAVCTRSDGYVFMLVDEGGGPRVWAGCRHGYTIKNYRRHVRLDYCGRQGRKKRIETLMILALFERVVKRPLPNI